MRACAYVLCHHLSSIYIYTHTYTSSCRALHTGLQSHPTVARQVYVHIWLLFVMIKQRALSFAIYFIFHRLGGLGPPRVAEFGNLRSLQVLQLSKTESCSRFRTNEFCRFRVHISTLEDFESKAWRVLQRSEWGSRFMAGRFESRVAIRRVDSAFFTPCTISYIN